jgi:FhaA, N-terminal domain/FHA domain
MGIFARFEKKVEGAVSGVFARAFKGDVQPVEIAARLQRELDAEAKLMSRDKRLVPNDFTVHLSQHDHDKLAPYANTLNAELAAELRNHAREMGYVFNGPIKIGFELDSRLPTGRFTVSSQAVAGITQRGGRPSETSISRAPLVLEVNGTRHPLQPPGLVIGRGSEADLRINDPGISRRHAQIRVNPAGQGLQIDIVDLGSTNGIMVNGQKVQQAALREGARIEIGSTRMLIHAPGGR